MVKLRRIFESSLFLESQKNLDDLRDYLGQDLFDDYMEIRERLPSISVFKKTYPDYEKEDRIDLKKLTKRYNTLRESPIALSIKNIDNYPSSIAEVDSDNLEEILSDYTVIRDYALNKITDYKDFQRLKKIPIEDVEDFLSNFQTSREKRQVDKEEAEKLYEDSEWKVYRITTYPAAQYYGKGTKWCIAGNYPGHKEKGPYYFNKYIEDEDLDGGYYFFLSKKDPSEKYCILQTKGKKVKSIWDAEDTDKGDKLLPDGVSLPIIPEVNLVKLKSVNLGGYSWTEIGILDGHSLYLCDQFVNVMSFNENVESNKWKDSDIRKWLNSTFYNRLTKGEKMNIVPSDGDNLFLLSEEEYVKFMDYIPHLNDEWWLRSPGGTSYYAALVNSGGLIEYDYVDVDGVVVRPAFLMKK